MKMATKINKQGNNFFTRIALFGIIGLIVLLGTQSGYAKLNAVGPINPQNGFPLWYQDENGLALEIGLDPLFNIADPVISGNIFSEQIGFGEEAFYFSADAVMDLRDGNKATLVLALEAAFFGGPPLDGDQFVFARLRIRIDTPVAGTYTVTHPYGVNTFENVAAGKREINLTVDIGAPTPGFDAALHSHLGPFLIAVDPAPPAGFIGDPGVDQTVTGSPFGTNYFRIDGPPGSNLDGAGNDFIQTDLFAVSGKIFTGDVPTPVTVRRTTYERLGADQLKIDVFAQAAPTATLTVDVGALPNTTMATDGLGNFFVRILRRTTTLPSTVTITADNAPNNIPTTIIRPLVDLVSIKRADYNDTAKVLIVEASSADQGVPPTLTVPGFGPLVNGSLTVQNVIAPPDIISVTSSAGGVDLTDTKVLEGNLFPIAVNDVATTVLNTAKIITVLANDFDPGQGGALDPTTVTVVVAPNTGGTAIANPDGTITYTPRLNFIGIERFSYTVKDNSGALSNRAQVTVTVTR